MKLFVLLTSVKLETLDIHQKAKGNLAQTETHTCSHSVIYKRGREDSDGSFEKREKSEIVYLVSLFSDRVKCAESLIRQTENKKK